MVTSPAQTPILVDVRGQRIALGSQLARGGEGAVYPVIGRPDLVAKVYHQAVSADKAAKLAAMAQLSSDRLRTIAAWPTDTMHEQAGGPIRGLLMPLVRDHQEIHVLYGPKTRRREFPDANLPFLLHTAANLARAFAIIHEHGHVIGDVNHGSVLVSKQGMVKLVDCDSFQISIDQRRFFCLVGVPTHTPPELQGKSFNGLVRTPDHDAFGLAVLIFQLLFLGRHPFSGTFLGGGDLSLERAIGEYRFAYGPQAQQRSMRQPPATPSLLLGTPPVAALFERAFSRINGTALSRPTAREWITTLEVAAKQLVVCDRHSGHHYPRDLGSCPWCSIEAATGVIVFNIALSGSRFTTPGIQPGPSFDLAALWSEIEAISDPGNPPILTLPTNLPLTPAPISLEHNAEKHRLTRIIRIAFAAGVLITLFSCVARNIAPGTVVGLLLLTAIGCFSISLFARQAQQQNPARQEAIRERDKAQAQLAHVERRWQAEAGNAEFHAERAKLVTQKAQYQGLAELRQHKVQELTNNARQRQREQFLDRHRIASASIPNIGPGRKATLQSYSIETAADVTQTALLRVPGFGPTLVSNLLAWRSIIESRFVFDPQRAIDPTDLANFDRELANQRALLEQSLRGGLLKLRRTVEQAQAARAALHPIGDQAQRALAQAEANLKIL